MAIDFPNSPSVGATYTVGKITWVYTGTSWDLSAAGIQGIQGLQGPAYVDVTLNSQSGTTYTFATSDNGKMVLFTNSSAVTATVPPNSSAPFAVGAMIDVFQYGTGQVTIAAGSGVTIRYNTGLKLYAQYCGAQLRKIGTDEWVLIGSLAA